jgi:flagellar motility protein MotE (MotC chaperone)
MIRYIRDLRLIPIALIASACLLTLKVADLALHGSALLSDHDASSADQKLSWAQQMFNFPDGGGAAPAPAELPLIAPRVVQADNSDITGSVTTEPAGAPAAGGANAKTAANAGGAPAAPPGKGAKPATAPPPNGTVIQTDGPPMPTGAERAVLERLQQRREELDTRAHELDIRESLIQGAEKRMDAKLAELKQVEAQIKAATQQKNDAAATQLKGLVTMYENMKARDAAKIFDGLDTNVLIEVSSQINPRTLADIVAQMQPEVAERLTVELADRAQSHVKDGDASASNLPKIEGQPTTP